MPENYGEYFKSRFDKMADLAKAEARVGKQDAVSPEPLPPEVVPEQAAALASEVESTNKELSEAIAEHSASAKGTLDAMRSMSDDTLAASGSLIPAEWGNADDELPLTPDMEIKD